MTVAQKCSGAMEIQKYDQRTNQPTDMDGLTWVGARDTCVSKNRFDWSQIYLRTAI